jgi:hypothetical protein
MNVLLRSMLVGLCALPVMAGAATTVFESGGGPERWWWGPANYYTEFGSLLELGGTERVLSSFTIRNVNVGPGHAGIYGFTAFLFPGRDPVIDESRRVTIEDEPLWTGSLDAALNDGLNDITFAPESGHSAVILPDTLVLVVRQEANDFCGLTFLSHGGGQLSGTSLPTIGSLASPLCYMPEGGGWWDWGGYMDAKIEATGAVPEPFTLSLGIAAVGLFLRRRMKKSQ